MRALRIVHDDEVLAAVEDADGLRAVPTAGLEPIEVIAADGWSALDRAATRAVTRDACRILAPTSRPGKILGIGLNYSDHAEEQGLTPPTTPVVFAKFATSVVGPDDVIPLYPATEQTDYEGELAVVIGRRASRVAAEDWRDHVAGYTICNDVTARDLQRSDVQWTRAKGADGYAPLGPVLVSPDEFGDPPGHRIRTFVNGQVRQDSDCGRLVFDVPALIAHITASVTLEPGDIIATGTPSGVGHYMRPPRYLQDGDEVVVEIEGIGRLRNVVARAG